jgi:hypothetical protein
MRARGTEVNHLIRDPEKKPQVPPLRYAPVGMTILLCP